MGCDSKSLPAELGRRGGDVGARLRFVFFVRKIVLVDSERPRNPSGARAARPRSARGAPTSIRAGSRVRTARRSRAAPRIERSMSMTSAVSPASPRRDAWWRGSSGGCVRRISGCARRSRRECGALLFVVAAPAPVDGIVKPQRQLHFAGAHRESRAASNSRRQASRCVSVW